MDGNLEPPKNSTMTDHKDVWSAIAFDAYTSKKRAAKVLDIACYGIFNGPAPAEAYNLNPPQIGINGGFAMFNQNCEDDRIKALKNFKPDRV